MSELDDKRLAEIRERANAATQGPWFWKQSYELDHGLHWELTNPELDKRGRTIDASLILAHDQPTWLHQPCETLPNWEFIAHAREDIDYLLSRVAAPKVDVISREDATSAIHAIREAVEFIRNDEAYRVALRALDAIAALPAVAAPRHYGCERCGGEHPVELCDYPVAAPIEDKEEDHATS